MSDERLGGDLIAIINRMPRGSGVIFRHYSLGERERRALFDQVKAAARKRNMQVILAGKPCLARAWGADGAHGRYRGAVTSPVHSVAERIAAERAGAQLLFVSPVFATQSHPGARPLGAVRFGLMIGAAKRPVIALGGMTQARARRLCGFGIYGWAAIDAFRT